MHRRRALIFPGQGAQFIGMAADLHAAYPAARRAIDSAQETLNIDLKEFMFNGENGLDVSSCDFALGHSLGEYSALVAADSVSFPDALKLVRLRGLLMEESTTKDTCMRAVIISPSSLDSVLELVARVQNTLPDGEVAQIANINSMSQIVLSGTNLGVAYMTSLLSTEGIAGRAIGVTRFVNLPVACPFHCSLMSTAAEKMRPALNSCSFSDPKIPVVSNVTAKPYENAQEVKELLQRQITETVRWQESTKLVHEDSSPEEGREWLVLGPAKVLTNLLKRDYPGDKIVSLATAKELERFLLHV
ncbi:MAG: hypothetical protein SGCHY_000861 [Lobulomycetales sp.]